MTWPMINQRDNYNYEKIEIQVYYFYRFYLKLASASAVCDCQFKSLRTLDCKLVLFFKSLYTLGL